MKNQPREYVPSHLRDAMMCTRLANAEECARGFKGMRYVITCNVHEGLDPDQPIWILDSVAPAMINVAELTQRLSEDNRKRVLFG